MPHALQEFERTVWRMGVPPLGCRVHHRVPAAGALNSVAALEAIQFFRCPQVTVALPIPTANKYVPLNAEESGRVE